MITSTRSSLFAGNCFTKQSQPTTSSTNLLGDPNAVHLSEGERPSNQPGATYSGLLERRRGDAALGIPLREIPSHENSLPEPPQSIASQPLGQRIWNFLKMLTAQTLPTNLGASRQGGRGDIERGNQAAENADRDEQSLRERIRTLGEITLDDEPLADLPTAPPLALQREVGLLGTTSTERHRRDEDRAFFRTART